MSKPKTPFIPKLTLHRHSGRGYVRIAGKCHYLGKYGDPATTEAYHRLVAELCATGGALPVAGPDLTVAELVCEYLHFAEGYYRTPDGTPTGELAAIRHAMTPLVDLYATSPAASIGPLALKAVRERMIALGWVRLSINRMVGRVKRLYRWACENERIPPHVYHGLQSVAGLKYGRSTAKESEPVRPVTWEHVEPVLSRVPSPVRAMILLQWWTGARSGELCILRPCDIDTSGPVWLARPSHHKTKHHGHARVIPIGPKAQDVLRPFLLRPADAYLFSPIEAARETRQRRTRERKTPLSCGNTVGSNVKARPEREPGPCYMNTSYHRAVARGIQQVNAEREPHERIPQWHPHQLRHAAATRVRAEHGLEAAAVILGHAKCNVTEIYAEANVTKALAIAAKVG